MCETLIDFKKLKLQIQGDKNQYFLNMNVKNVDTEKNEVQTKNAKSFKDLVQSFYAACIKYLSINGTVPFSKLVFLNPLC